MIAQCGVGNFSQYCLFGRVAPVLQSRKQECSSVKMNQYTDGAARGCLLILLLLTIPLIYFNFIGYRDWSNAKRLDQYGQVVQADVTDLSTNRNRSFVDYYVTYRLPAYLDEIGKTHEVNVSEEAYQDASQSRKIDVKILADHPEIQRAVGSKSPTSFLLYVSFFNIFLIIAIYVFMRGI